MAKNSFIDLTGNTINNLYVVKYNGDNYWECKCTLCGNTRIARGYELRLGKYKACKDCEKRLRLTGKSGEIQLVGNRFGLWEVLEYIGDKKYRCRCTGCNRIFEVYGSNIRKGQSNSCYDCAMKNRIEYDFVGTEIQGIKIIEYIGNSIWKAQCTCGEFLKLTTTQIKNKDIHKCITCGNLKDLKGQLFGNLKVEKYLGGGYWECLCIKCNSTYKVHGWRLRKGITTSCFNCNNVNKLIDISNKTFGYWKVIRYSGNNYWLCTCVCGTTRNVHGYDLRHGGSKSCGCKKWESIKSSLLQRYGEIAPCKIGKSERSTEQIKAVESKENLLNFIQKIGYKPDILELKTRLGLETSRTLVKVHEYNLEKYVDIGNKSFKENELYNYILSRCENKYIVLPGARSVIPPQEIDIYIPELKLAFEFNGTYWHSSIKKDRMYHKNKTEACKEKGIRLIHVFEYEWDNEVKREKIKRYIDRLIDNSFVTPIYAKDCDVCNVSNEETDIFLCNNHLQGTAKSLVRIGLKYNNELVAIMTFGVPRFSSECSHELIRLAFKDNIRVIGGAEKMFKYFLRSHNIKSVISYCDTSKFKGDVYSKLGFTFERHSSPNYVWVNPDIEDILSRYQTQKQTLLKLNLGTEDQTEDEIMYNIGYMKIYDCGNDVYIFNNSDYKEDYDF